MSTALISYINNHVIADILKGGKGGNLARPEMDLNQATPIH